MKIIRITGTFAANSLSPIQKHLLENLRATGISIQAAGLTLSVNDIGIATYTETDELNPIVWRSTFDILREIQFGAGPLSAYETLLTPRDSLLIRRPSLLLELLQDPQPDSESFQKPLQDENK